MCNQSSERSEDVRRKDFFNSKKNHALIKWVTFFQTKKSRNSKLIYFTNKCLYQLRFPPFFPPVHSAKTTRFWRQFRVTKRVAETPPSLRSWWFLKDDGVGREGMFFPRYHRPVVGYTEVDDFQRMMFLQEGLWYTLPKFNSSPLKSYRDPIGKDRLPTIIFQGRAVKLRGGTSMPPKSIATFPQVAPWP